AAKRRPVAAALHRAPAPRAPAARRATAGGPAARSAALVSGLRKRHPRRARPGRCRKRSSSGKLSVRRGSQSSMLTSSCAHPRGSYLMHRRLIAVASLLIAGLAGAQVAFPGKPITMVVPFPPGGLADIVARPVAEAISRELGQPVIVENKAGAGGGVGMAYAAKAPPDGYTVLMSLSSLTVLPEADVVLGRQQMYALSSLRPIARFTADPTVLAVRADAPWKTWKDFVEDAKKRPGAINYGSSGNYGTMHVPMEILAQTAGIKLTHVPFTGAGPAVVALLGGQIDAVSSGPATVLQHVKAGKLRVLAHWGNGKLEALPDVPSLKDAGYNAE